MEKLDEKKVTFDELVKGWYMDDIAPTVYDILPRDLKLPVSKWYQIVKSFEVAVGIKECKWILIEVKIPILRRMFPSLIASDLVGVQPMSGPVGHVFHLNYKYKSK
jgi:hypothetical protein